MLITQVREVKRGGDPAVLDAMVPYAAFVGLESRPDADGLLTVLRSRESNMGNTLIRAVHGGVVGALLEHAAIMQLIWESEPEQMPKIVNLSIDYLRPALCDKDLHARGTVIKQGRRVANVRVSAWQDDPERPVAAGHAHFVLL